MRAHPRVCGENMCPARGIARSLGSSPRVRGKLSGGLTGLLQVRLIPACAGKTSVTLALHFPKTAHPRVCGENHAIHMSTRGARGSSPRVRGKQVGPRHAVSVNGLIPACAGKTPALPGPPRRSRAHPRVCGENSILETAAKQLSGSSPRVRGKH